MNGRISRKMEEVLLHLWMKNFDDLKTYLLKSLHIHVLTYFIRVYYAVWRKKKKRFGPIISIFYKFDISFKLKKNNEINKIVSLIVFHCAIVFNSKVIIVRNKWI